MTNQIQHMKKFLSICSLLISCYSFAQNASGNRNVLFDADWRFVKDSTISASSTEYDDSKWRALNLPHDWSIEDLPNQSDSVVGPFTAKSIGATATGYTVGGIGWYRKHFTLNNIANKKVSIYFDGVYMNSDVWINGHHLGNHPYGYTPFYYDLTPYLKQDGENILAVRVSNQGKNSRWYSGSGIYRHVWLTVTNPVHVEQWGVYITTPEVSEVAATINIKTTYAQQEKPLAVIVRTKIFDAKNNVIATNDSKPFQKNYEESTIPEDKFIRMTVQEPLTLKISHPHLWSPESPYLYHTVSELIFNNVVIDHVETNFGIRSISITAEKGFLLNGKPIELKGGCVHHDNGPLGSATIDRAEERRIELLKQFGYNAVRTSHNPPSMQFLDACDRLGLIVIDEAFDQWQRHKNPDDYGLYFDTCWQRDIDAMVLRDRNHPSVVFWSIGNEINERADSSGLRIMKQLSDEVKRLDNTRPVTEALCQFWDHAKYKWDTTAAAYALLDVGGYNYELQQYETDHAKYPQRIIMGTESFPKEAFDNWQAVEQHPYVIGDFVWTAMDYMGETGIGHAVTDGKNGFVMPYPWFNAWCGDIDLIGGKKPQSYYRDIVWNRSKLEMLVHAPIPEGRREAVSPWGWQNELPSYTFPGAEGKPLQVHVYTKYDSVRLVLNGKIIGVQTASAQTKLTATFTINYEPGELKAIGFNNGKAIDSVVLKTSGKPAAIRLVADRKNIKADPNDLAYVTAEVIDANGNLVPYADDLLHFTISGNGKIIATGNADPSGVASMQQPQHKTFQGKCLAIVQPKGNAGKIILKAEAIGLKATQIIINTQ